MMMDPAVKTAMGLCVLLGGVCAAMLFRRDPPPASPAPPASELRIRSRADAAPVVRPRQNVLPEERRAQEASVGRRPATVVKPLNVQQSPPPLAPNYPETDRPSSSRWGASMDMMLPPRTHRIVDGDTLAELAQRYLGSAARAREIFDANRDVLSDPGLLPIGAELKIPPTEPPKNL